MRAENGECPMEAERKVVTEIPDGAAGLRLDVFLAARFTYRSRTEWRRAVDGGEIVVNEKRARPSRRLSAGDMVRFIPREFPEPEVDTDYKVIFDSPEYFAVDKPGCLPAHPSGVFFKNTLLALLRRDFGNVHIVNRLDRETSGIVLAAKNPDSARLLSGMFEKRAVEKKYVACVFGRFPEKPFSASGFIGADANSEIRKKRLFSEAPLPDGESARTEFRLLGTNGDFSFVEAVPHTGRLHQIRATLLYYGFPLAGDKLYGPDEKLYLKFVRGELDARDREKLFFPRQALHAFELSFRCPFRKSEITVKAPLPEMFSDLYRSVCGDILHTS